MIRTQLLLSMFINDLHIYFVSARNAYKFNVYQMLFGQKIYELLLSYGNGAK